MMKHRYVFSAVVALIAAMAGMMFGHQTGAATDSDRYTITGDVSAAYSNGEFVVWVCRVPARPAVGASACPLPLRPLPAAIHSQVSRTA